MFAYGKIFSSLGPTKIRFTITKKRTEQGFKFKNDNIIGCSTAAHVTENIIRDEFGSIEHLVRDLAQRNTHLIIDNKECLIVLAADRKTAKKEYKRCLRN